MENKFQIDTHTNRMDKKDITLNINITLSSSYRSGKKRKKSTMQWPSQFPNLKPIKN